MVIISVVSHGRSGGIGGEKLMVKTRARGSGEMLGNYQLGNSVGKWDRWDFKVDGLLQGQGSFSSVSSLSDKGKKGV